MTKLGIEKLAEAQTKCDELWELLMEEDDEQKYTELLGKWNEASYKLSRLKHVLKLGCQEAIV